MVFRKVRVARQAILFMAGAVLSAGSASACSRILWNDNTMAVVVGRTMDWPGSTEPVLTVFPRGMPRDGGRLGPEQVVRENPLRWISKYGSLVTTMYGLGAADGINECGLAAHLQYFTAADYGPRNAGKPGLQAGLWAQYLLDRAATVPEALAAMDGIQLVMAEARGAATALHLAIEDASGDSAIIEFIEGRRVVHHGRKYKVMTNDPPYDDQLALLGRQDFSKTVDAGAFGSVSPADRFLRASYFLSGLAAPRTEREAVSSLMGVTRNVSVPPGTPSPMGPYHTEYRIIGDLTHGRYFFELNAAPEMIWVDLATFNLAPGAPVMALKPDSLLAGDSSSRFHAVAAPF